MKVQTGYQILSYLREKKRAMKFQTNFKYSLNVALKINK